MTSLTVGDLQFEVRRSARRKSVQITVDRGGELLLSAPEVCPTRVMERFIREPHLAAAMGRESRRIATEKYDVNTVNADIMRHAGL